MLISRHIALLLLSIPVICMSASLDYTHDTKVFAQQPSEGEAVGRERGIQLYHQGDTGGAVTALRAVLKKNPEDLIAWDHLILALTSEGKKKEARKALKQVADLRLKRFQKEFDASSEKITDANIHGLELLHAGAFLSAHNYLTASSTDYESERWAALNTLIVQGEFLKLAREALTRERIVRWSEVPQEKVRVTRKPEPAYTEEARQNHVSGTVVIKAEMAADGKIKGLRVIRGLSHGLTERALEAARKLTFKPATIGGRPVSQYWQIEYNFNVF